MGNRNSPLQKDTGAGAGDGQRPFATSVLLVVHLSSGDTAQVSPPPPLAIAMVEDMLSASRCELKKGMASPIESVFPDLAQAVHAARRIARLVRSFCGASEENLLDGYLTVSMATDLVSLLDVSLLQQTRILEPTRPGQIFFVGAVCDEVRKVPGLRFTDVSGIVKARGTGMRNIALQLLPPFGMEEADGRPLMLKPSRPKPRMEPIAVAPEPVGKLPRIQTDHVDGPVQAKAETPFRPLSSTWLATTWLAIKLHTRAFLKRTNLGRKAGTAAAVAIAALIAIAIYLGHSSSRKVSLNAPEVVPTTSSQPAEAPSTEQHSATAASTGTSKVPEAVTVNERNDNRESLTSSTEVKRADLVHGRPQSRAEIASSNAPVTVLANKGVVSFTPHDINVLIEKADKEVGDGKFDAAIGNYSIVLNHDPANVRARQGIARARKNKGSG